MAIPLDRKEQLLDLYCPQSHIVSIVVRTETMPVLYCTVRGGTGLFPAFALALDGLATLVSLESDAAQGYHVVDERMPTVVVLCQRCRATYTLVHADCMAALALPTVKGRTPSITLRLVVSAKGR
jgi:hypothetical protein